ncbi:hypothetical protein OAB94_01825 [Flavobacteriaceae bacterium]|nr:hypothetical protein [Flavobacteriaceae bacterium]MDB9980475.1 hypothetical protein [bacterium]
MNYKEILNYQHTKWRDQNFDGWQLEDIMYTKIGHIVAALDGSDDEVMEEYVTTLLKMQEFVYELKNGNHDASLKWKQLSLEILANTEWLQTTEEDEVECIGIENLDGIIKRAFGKDLKIMQEPKLINLNGWDIVGGDGVEEEIWQHETTKQLIKIPIEIVRDLNNAKTI